jgi:hypothetical protein
MPEMDVQEESNGRIILPIRLDDRPLPTADWCSRFPLAMVENMVATSSAHGPILLLWEPREEARQRRRSTERFGYELMWETRFCSYDGADLAGGGQSNISSRAPAEASKCLPLPFFA